MEHPGFKNISEYSREHFLLHSKPPTRVRQFTKKTKGIEKGCNRLRKELPHKRLTRSRKNCMPHRVRPERDVTSPSPTSDFAIDPHLFCAGCHSFQGQQICCEPLSAELAGYAHALLLLCTAMAIQSRLGWSARADRPGVTTAYSCRTAKVPLDLRPFVHVAFEVIVSTCVWV